LSQAVRRAALGLLLWLLMSPAWATTICVNAAATGANNGGCWTDAYTSPQSALAAAGSGDEIWVAAATYKPTATTDRTINFGLKNGVGVYGGFVGTETMRVQRDPAAHVTILSGDIGTIGVASDNSYHVVTADATVTPTGVLDGFTITAGNANGAANNDRGGGMWINSGAPTVTHCIFTGNFASEKGGGLRVTSGSPVIDGCIFISNSASSGGGGIGAGSGSSFTVKNTFFRGNSTVSTGGAGIETASGVTVVNCVFQNNSGNGLLFIVAGTVLDSTFTGNDSYGVAFDQDGTVVNSILWADAIDEVFVGFGTISVSYSDVGGSGFSGTGNKSADPVFVNPAAGDLRLGPASPAVDAGRNASVPVGTTTDINGLPRFFDDPTVPDTGVGTPPIVDMGAYERVPLSVTAPSPSPQTVCAGASASFSVTASGQNPLSYKWRRNGTDLSNGGPISGATTAMLTINPTATGDAGSYDVVVTDGFGQSINSSTGSLTVNTVSPTAGNNGPICAGQTLQLTASNVSGATYSWTGPNGFTSIQENPTIAGATTAASGTYTVRATVSGCVSAPATTTATVLALPSAVISASSSVCANSAGNSASVPDAGPGSSYSWSITNGTITAGAGTRAITFSAGPSGSVGLSVVVTDSNGCVGNGSKTVTTTGCLSFYTLTPCRVLDTRGPAGPYGAPALAAGADRTFVFSGQCGIPPTAKAVSLNVAVTQPTDGPGFFTLFPGGVARPLAATINYNLGQTRANNAIIPLGSGGDITVHCGQGTGTAQIVVDVNGYFQ
jgi:hypothetical protein